jgi:hypothetical protein
MGSYSGFHRTVGDFDQARGDRIVSSDLYRPSPQVTEAEIAIGAIFDNVPPHVILTSTTEAAAALALSTVPNGGEMLVGTGVPRDIVRHVRDRTGSTLVWIEPSLRGIRGAFSDQTRTIFLPDIQLLPQVCDLRWDHHEILQFLEKMRFRGTLIIHNSMALYWRAWALAPFPIIAVVPIYGFWLEDGAFGGAVVSSGDLSDLRRTQLITGCHFLAPTSVFRMQPEALKREYFTRATFANQLACSLLHLGTKRKFDVGGTCDHAGSILVTVWGGPLDRGRIVEMLDGLCLHRSIVISDLVGYRFTTVRPLEPIDFPGVQSAPVGIQIAIGSSRSYRDHDLTRQIVVAVDVATASRWI